MDIYRIYTENSPYKAIAYGNTPLLENIGEDKWENIPQIESFSYNWNVDDKEKECGDCPFLIGAIPVFSTNVLKNIKKYLSKDLVDVISIKVENREYAIIKAQKLVANLLDERDSQITRYSDGNIMSVEKYVFKETNELPMIFSLSEYSLFTFVTGQLAEVLLCINPRGLEIEKCKIKKKWLWI